MPALRSFAFVIAATTVSASAFADETELCIQSHVEGQRLKRDGSLRAARDALILCSKPECPAMLVEECATLLKTVDGAVSTVVFEAKDPEGRDVADASVSSRGDVLASRLDGKAVEIDPGEYQFRFERKGSKPVDVVAVIREGDKSRRIAVKFAPNAPPPEPRRVVTPAFWIVGAVGVAGLALWGGLGGAGLAKRGDLDDSGCKPSCSTDDVDEIRGLFLGADISLGIGLAGLAVAPILFFTSPMETPRVALRPVLGGALLGTEVDF